ncbi:MAG: rhomboid family intramembrane serine protease [Bacteroidales bacterium]
MSQNNASFFNSIPVVTKHLLLINLLCWVACIAFQRMDIDLIQWLGLHYPASPDFKLFQLFTYMFLHDTRSIAHLFFNMFAVFMFGRVLENTWGQKRFLSYYLITGIGAALFNLLVAYLRIRSMESGLSDAVIDEVHRNGCGILHKGMNYTNAVSAALNLLINTPTVGASGAVFGILLAFGVLFPNAPLYLMFVPIPVKAKYFVLGYGVIELLLGVADFSGDNVAHFAHLGGMVFGYVLIRYWKKKDSKWTYK